MKVSLVIMAAGLGSRYGGSKQVDGIGPHNEILMEYSIYDALRAGFSKVVFIIKPEMEEMMRRLCGDYLARKTALDGTPVEVAYVFQDFTSVPDFYRIPPERTKPFGTVHALLCAADVVHEPFCVINADDYYGIDAYRTIYDELVKLPETGKATMVGYLLKNTASLHGVPRRVRGGGRKAPLRPGGTEDPAVSRRHAAGSGGGHGPVPGDGGVHELLGVCPQHLPRPAGVL